MDRKKAASEKITRSLLILTLIFSNYNINLLSDSAPTNDTSSELGSPIEV